MKAKSTINSALVLAVCLILLLVASPCFAGKVYLYVFFHDDNTNGERFRTEMPDMKTCNEVLKNAKMPMPISPAGDYEVLGAMWCGSDQMHRNYNATWWNDPVKNVDN